MEAADLAFTALICWAALCGGMAGAWLFQQRSGNSGWVDAIWSLSVGGVAVAASLWGPWPPGWRATAVATMAGAWSLRLALHLGLRASRAGDDPRYRHLADQWGAQASTRMFRFLQAQAVVGAVIALSVVLAARNPDPRLRVQDIIGLALLAAALAGEAIADWQLRRFKRCSAGRSAICDVGLWRWSRHPNYFFEWLAWLAYPIIAVDLGGHHPMGWLALAAPAGMYWVLVHVSGIPPLEAHMLRTRGETFRAYQRGTRPFLPLPPFK